MHLYAGKHVLFITTKNLDYLRNTQEIAKLRESAASVDVLGSSGKELCAPAASCLWQTQYNVPEAIRYHFLWDLHRS